MLLTTLLPAITLVGAAPIIRSQQAWSLTSTGEAYRESSTLTEGTIFPNCSYLKVSNVTTEVSQCSTVDVGSCNKSFVLLHGVKSVCAAAGTPPGCIDRGDAFCCYSTSAAPLCDKAFLRDSWDGRQSLKRDWQTHVPWDPSNDFRTNVLVELQSAQTWGSDVRYVRDPLKCTGLVTHEIASLILNLRDCLLQKGAAKIRKHVADCQLMRSKDF
eukprot:s571_g15.t1